MKGDLGNVKNTLGHTGEKPEEGPDFREHSGKAKHSRKFCAKSGLGWDFKEVMGVVLEEEARAWKEVGWLWGRIIFRTHFLNHSVCNLERLLSCWEPTLFNKCCKTGQTKNTATLRFLHYSRSPFFFSQWLEQSSTFWRVWRITLIIIKNQIASLDYQVLSWQAARASQYGQTKFLSCQKGMPRSRVLSCGMTRDLLQLPQTLGLR